MTSTITIPQIDLLPLFQEPVDGVKMVAEQIKSIYTNVGFAYLVNHQISEGIINAVFAAAKDFHALPTEAKMKIKQNDCFRGYVALNASHIKVSTEGTAAYANQLMAFVTAFEVSPNHPDYINGVYLAGPNQWPEELINFKTAVINYRNAILDLSHQLLTVFAIALGVDAHSLDEFFIDPSYFLRLQLYPKQPENIPDNLFGIAPHTDYGFFSILAQNEVEGLEIRMTNQQWITAPYIPNSLILNSGDMLRRWSNNTFRSTPHRVVNRSKQDRYSIPFFFEPNMHAIIEPLSSCINDNNPVKYPPVKYGDYLLERIQGNYGLGKRN